MTDEIRAQAERSWPAGAGGRPGFCFSFVRETLPEDALCLLGGVEDDVVVATPERGLEMTRSFDQGYPEVARAVRLGSWTVLMEIDGFQGTRREVLRSLSTGGEAVSVFRDAGETGQFTHAVDGTVRTCFDQLAPERRWGAEPDALLDSMISAGLRGAEAVHGKPADAPSPHDESGAGALAVDPDSAALTLVELMTGVRLREADTIGHLLTVPFHALLPDARPALRLAALEPHAPEAAARLAAKSRPTSRRELLDLVRGLAEGAGVADSEAVRAALAEAEAGHEVPLDRGSPVYEQVMAWQVDRQRAHRSKGLPEETRLDAAARAGIEARHEVGLAVRDAIAVLNKVR
ncbi:hypothetical protein FHR81_000025 [Actinoalloteichus hoggarensis]|uniref:Uncharacterized protein n=1 Tax=Actinoalloteichus hoggarensis TaxID=1470176 RepID=A0A221W379_9PSEU|nr:DUF6461 domain-containing protein [Actinoalloteichus hoggarensis]ASO20290.1 hypothetical protein AHOG_13235 [Actinoalloteichus hoggarensis]MBB5918996.1 hypothetical protein [Actinoalloteichus hoggarensis]